MALRIGTSADVAGVIRLGTLDGMQFRNQRLILLGCTLTFLLGRSSLILSTRRYWSTMPVSTLCGGSVHLLLRLKLRRGVGRSRMLMSLSLLLISLTSLADLCWTIGHLLRMLRESSLSSFKIQMSTLVHLLHLSILIGLQAVLLRTRTSSFRLWIIRFHLTSVSRLIGLQLILFDTPGWSNDSTVQ